MGGGLSEIRCRVAVTELPETIMKPRHVLPWTGITLLAGILAWASGSRALSGGKDEPWDILVGYGKTAMRKSDLVELRPNITQPVFLYLKNNGKLPKRNLTIELWRLGGK